MRPHPAHPFYRRGFTLVELLIVVSILGILAALVVPQFSSAADVARQSTLHDDVRYLRTQVMVYRAQHDGVAPGYPGGDTSATPTYEAFVDQLTHYSNAAGQTSETASAQFKYGPYLQRMPANPINSSTEIRFIAGGEPFPTSPSGTVGWVYQPSTASLAADVRGADADGIQFFDY